MPNVGGFPAMSKLCGADGVLPTPWGRGRSIPSYSEEGCGNHAPRHLIPRKIRLGERNESRVEKGPYRRHATTLVRMAMTTIKKNVPSLGSAIVGEFDDGFAYFRGIPYATVEKRWTHSRCKDSLESPFDATQFGPRCVQLEGEVLVSGGETDPTPGDDEFKCLNLNIAVPENALQGGAKLPVMFWIHG